MKGKVRGMIFEEFEASLYPAPPEPDDLEPDRDGERLFLRSWFLRRDTTGLALPPNWTKSHPHD